MFGGAGHAYEEPAPSGHVCGLRMPGTFGVAATVAANKLGMSRKPLSAIVKCRSRISPEIAIRLDRAPGGGRTGGIASISL